jgi:hypothetical protein
MSERSLHGIVQPMLGLDMLLVAISSMEQLPTQGAGQVETTPAALPAVSNHAGLVSEPTTTELAHIARQGQITQHLSFPDLTRQTCTSFNCSQEHTSSSSNCWAHLSWSSSCRTTAEGQQPTWKHSQVTMLRQDTHKLSIHSTNMHQFTYSKSK